MIFNSEASRMRRFNFSVSILAEYKTSILLFFDLNEAVMDRAIISRQTFSILSQIPKRSLLEILEEIR